jgi:hypothetical protein
MSTEASLQTDHLIGHVLPGAAYLILGIVFLYYIRDPDSPTLPPYFSRCFRCCRIGDNKEWVSIIKLTGWFLIIIAFVCFVLWMVDLGNGNYNTKIHRVLSMMVLPLGIAMTYSDTRYTAFQKTKDILKDVSKSKAQYDLNEGLLEDALSRSYLNIQLHPVSSLWKDFLPIYCFINAALYYNHHHSSMNMPDAEEECHTILFWLFMGSGIFFGVSQFLAILREQTVLFVFGSITIFTIGIWYIEIAIILYGGYYGVNGANYGDAAADFGITILAVSCFFMGVYIFKMNLFTKFIKD